MLIEHGQTVLAALHLRQHHAYFIFKGIFSDECANRTEKLLIFIWIWDVLFRDGDDEVQLFESAEKPSHHNSDLHREEIAAVAPIRHIDDGSLLSAVHPGQPLPLFLML